MPSHSSTRIPENEEADAIATGACRCPAPARSDSGPRSLELVNVSIAICPPGDRLKPLFGTREQKSLLPHFRPRLSSASRGWPSCCCSRPALGMDILHDITEPSTTRCHVGLPTRLRQCDYPRTPPPPPGYSPASSFSARTRATSASDALPLDPPDP